MAALDGPRVQLFLDLLCQKEEEVEADDLEDGVSVTGCRLRSTRTGSGSTVDTCSYVSPVHASRGRYFYAPFVPDSHLFGASLEKYVIWIFWEMTSGIISACSALGSTVDTCIASVTVYVIFTAAYI